MKTFTSAQTLSRRPLDELMADDVDCVVIGPPIDEATGQILDEGYVAFKTRAGKRWCAEYKNDEMLKAMADTAGAGPIILYGLGADELGQIVVEAANAGLSIGGDVEIHAADPRQ